MRATPAAIQARGSAGIAAPASVTVPVVRRRASPHSTSASACWPLPDTPAIAEISPARSASDTSSAHAAHRRRPTRPSARTRPRPAHAVARDGLAHRRGRPSAPRAASRSAVARSRASRRACRARSTAIAIGHAQHLGQLVADEDDRQAFGDQPLRASRTARRIPAASAPPSARRGSARARRDTAPSGSRRAAARRPTASPTRASGSTRKPKRLAGRDEPRARLAPVATHGRHSGSVPSITLSSTDRLSASVKCWWTMPMPAASAAAGSPGGSGLPNASIVPASGDVVAEQDRHQRRLARAVLAEQREHLAARRASSEIVVVGDERAEALGDAGEAQAPASCWNPLRNRERTTRGDVRSSGTLDRGRSASLRRRLRLRLDDRRP